MGLGAQPAEELSGRFNPQPWLQAAAVLRAMGHDEKAQDLAIAITGFTGFTGLLIRDER